MLRSNITWLALFAVITVMFLRLPPMVARQDSVLNTYRALVEVDALAKERYVEPIHDARLVEGAIRGMMHRLDPYSGYIAPEELPAFERRYAGHHIGIGLEIGLRDGRPVVIAPLEGGPAAAAGIAPGDVLLTVNGHKTEDMSLFEIEDRLVGRPGSAVRLVLQRRHEPKPRECVIRRGPVTIETVRGIRRDADGDWDYMIDRQQRIAYVVVTSFHETTMAEFNNVLGQLQVKGARGLVLDLRFNPGGLMEQAGEMVDRFVEAGTILSTITRRKAVRHYVATRANTLSELPLVVLINESSASSAEIVAGALQDHGRAVIVGERSFGKGSVQHLIYLDTNGGAIKLTTAYYCLPSGRIIHRTPDSERADTWGIKPDVTVALDEQEFDEMQRSRQRRERGFVLPTMDTASHDADSAARAAVLRDRQLQVALAQLRERASLVGANHR